MASTVRSRHTGTSVDQIIAWGDGLALRLTKPMAKTAGVTEGTSVRITVRPGRIVIEAELEPTLEQMLAAFDPKRHGGELIVDRARGVETFA
jgi:antitoxin MazE